MSAILHSAHFISSRWKQTGKCRRDVIFVGAVTTIPTDFATLQKISRRSTWPSSDIFAGS
jgi:hypothetical protein